VCIGTTAKLYDDTEEHVISSLACRIEGKEETSF